jgi:hypothetical protein
MELGNMVWGNSRGSFELERGNGFEEEFQRLQDRLKMDYHCEEFENNTFWIFPYYWGECTCGFDAIDDFNGPHHPECYQTELERERIKAGWARGEFGFLEPPKEMDYGEYHKAEDGIYKRLTKKYRLPMQGCAVHCTCDYEDRYLEFIKSKGYPDGHKPDCLLLKPNFLYKPKGFEIQWYKYPFRDSYTSHAITLKDFSNIMDDCINSLRGDKNFANRMGRLHARQTYWRKKREALDAEGWLCHRCTHGLPLKNKKVICDMVGRNWQTRGNINMLMLPDGTEIDWKKECEYFVDWENGT